MIASGQMDSERYHNKHDLIFCHFSLSYTGSLSFSYTFFARVMSMMLLKSDNFIIASSLLLKMLSSYVLSQAPRLKMSFSIAYLLTIRIHFNFLGRPSDTQSPELLFSLYVCDITPQTPVLNITFMLMRNVNVQMAVNVSSSLTREALSALDFPLGDMQMIIEDEEGRRERVAWQWNV